MARLPFPEHEEPLQRLLRVVLQIAQLLSDRKQLVAKLADFHILVDSFCQLAGIRQRSIRLQVAVIYMHLIIFLAGDGSGSDQQIQEFTDRLAEMLGAGLGSGGRGGDESDEEGGVHAQEQRAPMVTSTVAACRSVVRMWREEGRESLV